MASWSETVSHRICYCPLLYGGVLPHGNPNGLGKACLKARNGMLVINRASQVGAAQFIDQLLFDLEDEVATRPHEITMRERGARRQREAPQEFLRF